MELNLVTADATKLHDIENLVNQSYRGEESKNSWTSEYNILAGKRINNEELNIILKNRENQIEVLLNSIGKVIACIQLTRINDYNCEFGMLAVNVNYQNKGLGKILLNHASQIAKNWGCQNIKGYVMSNRTELIDYYSRYGFVITGATKKFPLKSKLGSELLLMEICKKIK